MTKSKLKKSKRPLPFLSLIIITFALVCAGVLVYCIKNQFADIERQEQIIADSLSANNRLLLERDLAKKAEQEAKAQKEREEAERLANQKVQVAGVKCRPVSDLNSTNVVVNKKNCFSPIDWAPSDLVDVGGGHHLRAVAAQAYKEMRASAQKDGIDFWPSSAYRSYKTQQSTYQYWVRVNGSASVADTVSARAGFSEHQTGLAVDFQISNCMLECFTNKSAYHWLVKNADKFGFIQRYQVGTSHITGYSAESWHWRFVGVEIAQDMKAKNIKTLEEYFNIEGGDYMY